MDHDQLFKSLLKLFFPDLVALLLPTAQGRLDLEHVRFLEQESFSDLPAGDRVLLDLVAEAPTLDDGEVESILFLTEVEGEFRRASERRFWRYWAHTRLKHDRPALLAVIWLRGGPEGISRQQVLDQVLGQEVNRFTYWSFALASCPAEEFLTRPEPLAWALSALMRTRALDPVEHKLACLRAIAHAQLDELRRFVLLDTVETYLQLNEEQAERYAARLSAKTEDEEVRAMAMTWSQKMEAKGYERGIENGIERGIERGRAQGQHRLLQRLLERRFGPLPEGVLERLAAIRDSAALERLGEQLFDARSLEELGLVA